jgi:type II secretory ATPase GspE/PulE/Tfp pilus assembly ATPase PilB-like protein
LLELRGELRDYVATKTESEIRKAVRAAGLKSMTEQAVEWVLAGDVSVHEAYRNCYFGGD